MFKEEAWFNLVLFLLPLLLGLIATILIPSIINNQMVWGVFSIVLYVLGFILFFVSKISVIKKGKIITFGSSHMSKKLFYIEVDMF